MDQPSVTWKWVVTAACLLIASCLLFARLGQSALWDDEAYTALLAEGISRTGDTSIVLGHNLLAFGHGWNVTHLHDRFFPPLPFYMSAASLKVLGNTSFAARMPFALCGLATFGIILLWLWQSDADAWTWGLTLFPLLVNVCFLLYFRQCRYYGVIILMTVLLAYWYLRRRQWLMLIPTTALLASNYMSFFSAAACLMVDWTIWGRRSVRLRIPAVVCQLGIAALLLAIWNPLGAKPPVWMATSTLAQKVEHLWWNVRDLSVNEFCIIPLLLLVPMFAWIRRDAWLARGGVAAVVYFAVVSCLAPRGEGGFAEVRYFCPMIPLLVFLEARALRLLTPGRPVIAAGLGAILFGTNLLSGATLFHSGVVPIPPRSSIVALVRQLWNPPTDCYAEASRWVNENVPANAGVLVVPQIATYPLMFHAPEAVYAWQLPDPPPNQFEGFDDIHYEGRVPPDYIVIFGAEGCRELRRLHLSQGYKTTATIPQFGMNLFKPELFLHVFELSPPFDPDIDGVYVMQRIQQSR